MADLNQSIAELARPHAAHAIERLAFFLDAPLPVDRRSHRGSRPAAPLRRDRSRQRQAPVLTARHHHRVARRPSGQAREARRCHEFHDHGPNLRRRRSMSTRRKHRNCGLPPRDAKNRDAKKQDRQAQAEAGLEPAPGADKKSGKIAKRFTRKAFNALVAVMQDQAAAPTARVSAANTILEWGHGRRGEAAKAPFVIEKVIEIDWGEE
jgi:hypothetical protein